ncbi:MAG TPA: transglutaminase family protein [Bacteroidales bacterium]|nr:transglutaminase family protein [Bacteroidales bacterium]
MKTGEEIEALISLLDDPDKNVSVPVINRLIQMGEPVIKLLEHKWQHSSDLYSQNKLEAVVSGIEKEKVLKDIKDWLDCRGEHLLFGSYLIARSHNRDIGYRAIESEVKKLRTQIWLELNDHLTAFEKVRVINHFLFDVHNFSFSDSDFFSPHLYFINHALKYQKAQPVLLAIIYLEIAEQLELPIFGVSLPGHFLLCYQDKTYLNENNGVMFYINPAAKGNIFGKDDLKSFLKDQNLHYEDYQLQPTTKVIAIRELVIGLQNAYKLTGDDQKAELMSQVLKMFK